MIDYVAGAAGSGVTGLVTLSYSSCVGCEAYGADASSECAVVAM